MAYLARTSAAIRISTHFLFTEMYHVLHLIWQLTLDIFTQKLPLLDGHHFYKFVFSVAGFRVVFCRALD